MRTGSGSRWVAALLLGLAAGGCSRDWSDPRAVLTRFLEAWYEQDLEEVHEHLAAADRAHRSVEKYVALYGTGDSVVVGPLLRRSTFEIESIEEEALEARARVRVTEPNMPVVMNGLLNEAFGALGSASSPADFDRALERRYRHKQVPMLSREKVFAMVYEEGGWKVDLRWPVEMQVAELMLRALQREERGDYAGARDDYRAALALDDTRIELEKRIESVETRMLPQAEQARRSQEALDAYLAGIREERRRRQGF